MPLIKKPGLDREIFKKYRPVSNRSFLSKVIEQVISIRILGHILDNNIVDSFQSAYTYTYVINNCINSLHSGLAIKELCMARDGGKLENFDYSDCLTFIDLLCVS